MIDQRISAKKALKHPFLRELYDADKAKLKASLNTIYPSSNIRNNYKNNNWNMSRNMFYE